MQEDQVAESESSTSGSSPLSLPPPRPISPQVLDLRAPSMRMDPRPLVVGCGCHACRNHTRQYVHHLLLAHEMLAEVLLQLHNLHHLLDFFAAARKAIDAGTFPAFCRRIDSGD